ncbi:hypothetical protein [Streptomyces lasiicapitis]|uniref:DUF1508 domain-containing protein n=1 Tax=Streptomyces lasiicapitis TaxID=1923961 RepID=A0ABQ2LIT0_9ACTN|nr:hypothetical protein [Streptomyces lasiicapitis]GGO35161.1 hypothetical protein GCM10012286_05400 [Streptomyces lasiicapitis]
MEQQPKEAARTARSAVVVAGTRCQIDINGEGEYGWRLVAPNGRSVAVSPLAYASHTLCRAAFVALCADRATLAGGIQHSTEGGGWVWVLWDAPGHHVAASARTYERHATCRTSYERFRALLAELDPQGTELWGRH